MAITFVGATSSTANGTSVSVTPHASTAVDDAMLAFLGMSTTASPATEPSGWTLIQQITFSGSTRRLNVYRKVATPGDLGTPQTWTYTATINWAVTIVVFTGINAANPVNNSNIVANAASVTWSISSGLAILNKPYVMAVCGFYGAASAIPTVNSPLTTATGAGTALGNIAGNVGYELITSAIGARNATGQAVGNAASVVYLQDTSEILGQNLLPADEYSQGAPDPTPGLDLLPSDLDQAVYGALERDLYVMRAYHTSPPLGFVYWEVFDDPDTAANFAPYPPVQLTDILIQERTKR